MNITIDADTIRKATNYVGKVIFDNDCVKSKAVYQESLSKDSACLAKKEGVLYIEADGAMFNTRKKNADDSSWRENKLGEVFTSDNIDYRTDKFGKKQDKIRKKEYISYVGKPEEFKKQLLMCAVKNGYGKYTQTVVISDGAAWIRKMTEEMFPDAQHILDFYHLSENVYEYSKTLFKSDEKSAAHWAKRTCEKLRKSEYEDVLAELKTHNPQKDSKNLFAYISNNVNSIDYAAYDTKGFFIGSGAIESGNKTVLQQRLKQGGMRWNVKTAQYLLTLRAKAESQLWDSEVVLLFLEFQKGIN